MAVLFPFMYAHKHKQTISTFILCSSIIYTLKLLRGLQGNIIIICEDLEEIYQKCVSGHCDSMNLSESAREEPMRG